VAFLRCFAVHEAAIHFVHLLAAMGWAVDQLAVSKVDQEVKEV
jgi:hypothetical protein